MWTPRSRHGRFRHGLRLVPVAACVVVALSQPAPAAAQAEPLDEGPPRSPLALLLEHGAALDLTPGQTARVEGIRARLARANEPLVARMMTLRARWRQERAAERQGSRRPTDARLQRIRAAAAPLHARIQRNNRTAMRAVNQVLVPVQRARLRALVAERRESGAADAGAEGFDTDGERERP